MYIYTYIRKESLSLKESRLPFTMPASLGSKAVKKLNFAGEQASAL